MPYFKLFTYLLLIHLLFSCGVSKSLKDIPDISNYNQTIYPKEKINDSTFISGPNSLVKNKYGTHELFVTGNPYQIGLETGLLTQKLFAQQEDAFLQKVAEFVPSKFKQSLLRKLIAYYNRKMYLHIPSEYKTEIYGLSKYASNKYNYVATPYLRVMYLHGAHDIGHALQDLALVGCTSFAAWGNKTEDGQLIIGRNFDFYAGDDFAKNKIIAFVKPTNGYAFMSVTWPGMIGVVSGMNQTGLTVTINAGKSKIPWSAKTPITIVTREILQYASTIQEAIDIAKKREVFVSEAILVGSATDKKAISIEMAPNGQLGVYQVENNSQLICANHFQSEAFKNDKKNNKHINESHSLYRYQRLEELLNNTNPLTVTSAIAILRNTKGLHDTNIGYGNEKALNQLLAHHGIVFKPEEKKVWVSSNPYQLGDFVAYNLDEIFTSSKKETPFFNEKETIAKDSFLYTKAYKNYQLYRKLNKQISKAINKKKHIPETTLHQFQQTNPDFWEVHYLIGKYYYQKGYYKAALLAFNIAKTKEITTTPDRAAISKYIKKIKRKLNL